MTGDTLDTAINLVITLGCAMYAVTPHLERALGAYAAVYRRCPWIQTPKRNYNYVRQMEHVEALRHGYSSVAVFLDYADWNRSGMPASPRSFWPCLSDHAYDYLVNNERYLMWPSDAHFCTVSMQAQRMCRHDSAN